jgi:hypothetical protein
VEVVVEVGEVVGGNFRPLPGRNRLPNSRQLSLQRTGSELRRNARIRAVLPSRHRWGRASSFGRGSQLFSSRQYTPRPFWVCRCSTAEIGVSPEECFRVLRGDAAAVGQPTGQPDDLLNFSTIGEIFFHLLTWNSTSLRIKGPLIPAGCEIWQQGVIERESNACSRQVATLHRHPPHSR